jgi:hypothetical protein
MSTSARTGFARWRPSSCGTSSQSAGASRASTHTSHAATSPSATCKCSKRIECARVAVRARCSYAEFAAGQGLQERGRMTQLVGGVHAHSSGRLDTCIDVHHGQRMHNIVTNPSFLPFLTLCLASHNTCVLYLRPLRLAPSVALTSAPLVSPPLVAPPVFRRTVRPFLWRSGIHSSARSQYFWRSLLCRSEHVPW